MIEVVIGLNGHAVECESAVCGRSHEEFVVKTACGTENTGQDDGKDPAIVSEVDSFFFSATAQEIEGEDGDKDAGPLPEIERLLKDEDGAEEDENGSRGINGADESEGEVFHPEVAEEPGGKDERGLDEDISLRGGVSLWNEKEIVVREKSGL